jgi:hypothetical protein
VSGSWPTATSRTFTFEALGWLADTIRGALMMDARVGCLRAAVAVERFRLAKGALPAKLDELVPDYLEAVPLDPFDGKPLRYSAIDEKSYKVWSIGFDGKDDGGNDLDVTFSVERLSAAGEAKAGR